MRISDWSSDVCSSDLYELQARTGRDAPALARFRAQPDWQCRPCRRSGPGNDAQGVEGARAIYPRAVEHEELGLRDPAQLLPVADAAQDIHRRLRRDRSEEHTSELQSLMRISYAVFCLKKKKTNNTNNIKNKNTNID